MLKKLEKITRTLYFLRYQRKLLTTFSVVFLCSLALLFANSNDRAKAAFTEKLNYQGKLFSVTGRSVVDGNIDMVFRLYADPATSSAIWTSSSTSQSLFTDAGTAISLNSATCGGAGFDLITYTSNTNESTLQPGQMLWNVSRKQSAIIKSNSTGVNNLCIYHPLTNWLNGETVTNRIYVKNGLFNTMLGDFDSLSGVDFNQQLYLGITIGTDAEMKPRRLIGSVPTAIIAKKLNGLTWDNPGVIGSSTQNSAFFTQLAVGTSTFQSGGVNAMLNLQATSSYAALSITSSSSQSLMFLDQNGNLGLGTTSPQARFDATLPTSLAKILFRDTSGAVAFKIFISTSSSRNTVMGMTLASGAAGDSNSVFGSQAMLVVSTTSNNTAVGSKALSSLSFGDSNSAIGESSLSILANGSGNVAIGKDANASVLTIDNSTFVGAYSGALSNGLSNVTAIGYGAQVGASNTFILGGTGANAVNVGIGSSSSNATLMVQGNGNYDLLNLYSSTSQPVLKLAGNGNLAIGSATTSMAQFYVSGLSENYSSLSIATSSPYAGTRPVSIFAQGRYVYVSNYGTYNLSVFDVSNPVAPKHIATSGAYNLSGSFSVYVQGRYAYMAHYNSDNISIIDISNPAAPLRISTSSAYAGSHPYSIYVQGRYAYTANSATQNLSIFDISNPTLPLRVGVSPIRSGAAPYSVFLHGRYAYLANYLTSDLSVIDIADPKSPQNVGATETYSASYPISVYVQGRYAYLANSETHDLSVVDISDPTMPQRIGTSSAEAGTNPNSVVVQGGYAYLANKSTGNVSVMNISNPTVPVRIASTSVYAGSQPYAIAVQGRYAYLANYGSNNISVVDIGGAYLQQAEIGGLEAYTLEVQNNAIISNDLSVFGGTNITGGLAVYGDASFYASSSSFSGSLAVGTSTPNAQLTIQGQGNNDLLKINSSTSKPALTVAGNGNVAIGSASTSIAQLYVNGAGGTFVPYTVGSVITESNPHGVFVQGRYAYVTNFASGTISIVDVSDPSQPQQISTTSVGSESHWPHEIFVHGRYAYTVNYNWGTVSVVDISNPKAPLLTGAANVGAGPHSLYVKGRYLYVADVIGSRGNISTLDISNPLKPLKISNVSVGYSPYSIVTQGKYAFTANSASSSMSVVDISNPLRAVEVGSTSVVSIPESIAVQGRYAYISSGFGWFQVIDISEPATPTTISSLVVGANAYSLKVQGRYAYVVNSVGNNLAIVDIASSTAPSLVSSTTINAVPYSIFVQGRYAYVANNNAAGTGNNKLSIVDIGGAYLQQAEIGGLEAYTLEVQNNAIISNDLSVFGGVNLSGGIAVIGESGFYATSTSFSGSVSIGTTSTSTAKLWVAGGIKLEGGIYDSAGSLGSAGMMLWSTATSTRWVSTSSLGVISASKWQDGAGNIYFSSSTGGVAIGTSTVVRAGTPSMIQIQGTSSNNLLAVLSSTSNPALTIAGNGNVAIGSASTTIAQFYVSGISSSYKPTFMSVTQRIEGVGTSAPGGIFVQGNYAYLANLSAHNISIFDVSDPANPKFMATSSNTNGGGTSTPYNLTVQGRYAYVANYGPSAKNLGVIDISNASQPILVATSAPLSSAAAGPIGLYVRGRYAYMTNYGSPDKNISIVDISNPASPLLVATSAALLGSANGPWGIYVQGNYAYVTVTQANYFAVLDVSNPAAPTLVSTSSNTCGDSALTCSVYSIYLQGRYAYMTNFASAVSNFSIYDVSNPAAPVFIATSSKTSGDNSTSNPYDIRIQGRYAYITNYDQANSNFAVYDVSNPAAPVFVATSSKTSGHTGSSSPFGLFVQGRYAYIVNRKGTEDNIAIYDIGGAYLQQAEIGGLEAYSLEVQNNAIVSNDLSVFGGANITGGLAVFGDSSIYATSTVFSGAVSVGTSSFSNGASLYVAGSMALAGGLLDSANATGTNGMVLISTGSSTKWVSTTTLGYGTGASPWITSGNNIYFSSSTGGVVIGASTSTYDGTRSMLTIQARDSNNPLSVLTTTSKPALTVGGNGNAAIGSASTSIAQFYVSGVSNSFLPIISGISGNVDGGSPQPYSVYVQGRYAYTANFGTNDISVIDVSNPASPLLMSTSSNVNGGGTPQPISIYAQGRYAYTANYTTNSMSIIDISNPVSPTLIATSGNVNGSGFVQPASIYVQGRYAYTANRAMGNISIIDVSNPFSPVLVATSSNVNGAGLPWPVSIYVQGRYAYTANYNSPYNISIIDISNPGAPIVVGSSSNVNGGGTSWPNSIFVQGRYAYTANAGTPQNISIIDVSSPAAPRLVATSANVNGGGSPQPYSIFVQGKYAYTANATLGTFSVIDVSSSTKPRLVATSANVNGGGTPNPRSVFVQGRYAYTSNSNTHNITTIDIGGAYLQQAEIGGLEAYSLEVQNNAIVSNDLSVFGGASITGGLTVYSDASFYATSTGFSGHVSIGTTSTSSVELYVNGGLRLEGGLFDSAKSLGSSGMILVSTGTSTDWVATSSVSLSGLWNRNNDMLNFASSTYGVAIGTSTSAFGGVNNMIQIQGSSTNNLMSILSSSSKPAFTVAGNGNVAVGSGSTSIAQFYVSAAGASFQPYIIGTVGGQNRPIMVAVQGKYAYVPNMNGSTLNIIDVSNPRLPINVGTSSAQGGAFFAAVSGRYAYVANSAVHTFNIIDISNPSSPTTVGTLSGLSGPVFAYIQGKYAYVVNRASSSLLVIDISNPASPSITATAGGLNSPLGVHVQGRYAYVVNEGIGVGTTMITYDVSNPLAPVAIATTSGLNSPQTVYVQGRYAYVTNYGSNALNIIDISNPAAPVNVGTSSGHLGVRYVSVQGRYAYVANMAANTLNVVDVSDPIKPASVATISGLDQPVSVSVQGRYAYVANYGVGGNGTSVSIIDVGGAYLQQAEIGELEAYALEVQNNAIISNDLSVFGGTNISGGLRVDGGVSFYASSTSFSGMVGIATSVPVSVGQKGLVVQGDVFVQGNSTTTGIAVMNDLSLKGLLYDNSRATGTNYSLFTSTNSGTQWLATTSFNNQWSANANGIYYVSTSSLMLGTSSISGTMIAVQAQSSNNALTVLSSTSQPALTVAGNGNVAVGSASTTIAQFYVSGVSSSYQPVFLSATPRIEGTGTSGPSGVFVRGNYAYVANLTANNISIFDVSNPANPALMATSANTNGGGTSTPYHLSVQGRYAYVANYGASAKNLAILDVSNPAQPILISTSAPLSSAAAGPIGLHIQGRYAYVANFASPDKNISILDISNPSKPTLIATSVSLLGGTNGPWGIYVQGRYAYVTVPQANYFAVLDVSNPSAPALVSTSSSACGDASLSCVNYNIYVQGRYAYVANYSIPVSNFAIFDVSNPSAPIFLATSSKTSGDNSTSTPYDIKIQGRYAYITNFTAAVSNFAIYDVSNPSAPIFLATSSKTSGHTGTSSPFGIFVQGRYAYVANRNAKEDNMAIYDIGGAYLQQAEIGGLEAYALEVQNNAIISGDLSVFGGANISGGLNVTGNVGFYSSSSSFSGALSIGTTSASAQLTIQGTSSNNLLSILSSTSQPALTVAGNGNVAIGSDNTSIAQFYVSGIKKGAAPIIISSSTPSSYSSDFSFGGRYLYAANTSSILIIDTSNPLQPTLASTFGGFSGAAAIAVQGKYAYVGNSSTKTMNVVDISKPLSPIIISTTTVSGPPRQIYVQGRYAYLVNFGSLDSFNVIDISNPAYPLVLSTTTLSSVRTIAVQGKYAYISDYGDNSMKIFDISNPIKPVNVGSTTNCTQTQGAAVQGRYVYASIASGVNIIDASNPANPTVVGASTGGYGGSPNSFVAQGRYLFFADYWQYSLKVVDVSSSTNPVRVATTVLPNNQRFIGAGMLKARGRYLYGFTEGGSLNVFDIGGAYLQQAEIGGLEAYSLEVQNNAIITNDLSVGGGLAVSRGLAVYGDSSFYATSTAFSGSVVIGSSSPATSSYALLVNGLSAQVGATTWTNLSDSRTKDIKGDYTRGLSEIISLNPKYYSYKSGFGAGAGETYTGFIAQDVADIIPEAVSTSSDGYLRLNADPILWAMVNGIKELESGIRNQESRIGTGTIAQVAIINPNTSDKQALLVRQENAAQDIASFENSDIQVMKISGTGRVSVVGSLSVDGRSLVCAGACPQALETQVDPTRGDMGAEGKVVAAAFESYCPADYSWVPGSAKYGTMPGFCVMQREARTSASAGALTAGTDAGLPPAGSIDWYEAKQACQNIGSGYHLVTEPEWLTLAENLANASSSNLGTSSEKTLSNRQPVYDLASSLSEWVDKYVSSDAEKPKPLSENWAEYSSISDYNQLDNSRLPNDTWNSSDGVGRILTNASGGGLRAFVRGGSEGDGIAAGLWSLRLDITPTNKEITIGFRCTK